MMRLSFQTLVRKALLSAGALALVTIPAAFAQEAQVGQPVSPQDEVKQFCTNIADPARDQRYLLQKQDLEKLRTDVDSRIAELDKRKAEYQDWLQRRNDFLKKAQADLTDIYKKMKPDIAAQQLAEVRPDVAAAVIMQLNPSQSSLILNEMDVKKAAMIANIIASASDPNTSKDPS
ncbi:MotE family protein [Oryzifoliimicrobium ureilyticus]|uniref:MotE family protein n=1 Tax=Oryzifoliimicrobium ureilyticus TaxID=3113724 RepID=UPI003076067D